jgi:hypothetical protein
MASERNTAHATIRRRGSEHLERLLPEITVFLVIFAFVVATGLIAPRILDPGMHTPPIGVATYSPSNFSLCSVRAWPDGLRSNACARPLPRMGLGSHHCC